MRFPGVFPVSSSGIFSGDAHVLVLPRLELAKLANLGIWEVLWQRLAALDGTVLDGKRHVLPRKGMGIFVINWG